MRYIREPTVIFTDRSGQSYEIKETRRLEVLTTMLEMNLRMGDAIDEIATRKTVYGDEAEVLAYKIFDHNAVAIADAGYDLSRLKTLKIPQV